MTVGFAMLLLTVVRSVRHVTQPPNGNDSSGDFTYEVA
jgi:hypothetical protein